MKNLLLLILSLLLIACEGQGPKQTAGSLVGAAAGGLLGAHFGKGDGQLVGVALGTLIGSQVGGAIGRQMDDQDRRLAGSTMYQALENTPDNRQVTWRNPNKNHSGKVMVTRTVEGSETNKVCRDYVHTVNIDGQEEKVYGRACRDVRDPKGQWIIK